ncbi:MAG: hypothetical protein DLM69_00430, partial [Candidatus Chloroheliales bacterium]
NDPTLQDQTQRLIPPVGASNPLTSSWAQVPAPTAGPAPSYLYGVAMLGNNDGWAVGNYGEENSLIERWNGTAWSVFYTGTFNTIDYNGLEAVDALSSSEAYAVGFNETYPTYQPLIMHWDGTAWGLISTTITNTTGFDLSAVKEFASNDVWVVGQATDQNYNPSPLALHYDGSNWTQVAVPTPGAGHYCSLSSVAGGGGVVWAVGSCDYSSSYLVRWNGTSWTQISLPSIGTQSGLSSVVSTDTNNAWAFGNYEDSNYNFLTLIYRWNGSSWTQQNSPSGPRNQSYLFAAVAISPTELWAVGDDAYPLRLHTTDSGNTWALVGGPGGRGDLDAVAAAGAGNVMAVGSHFDVYHTRVEHWDGTAWTQLPNYPVVGEAGIGYNGSSGNNFNFANAVALDSNHAWAVGAYDDGNPALFTWNGNAWNALSTTLKPAGAYNASFFDVSASAPNDVWAVGRYLTDQYHYQVIHYNGTTWAQVPNSDYFYSTLVATSPTDLWVAGSSYIDHYDGSVWRRENIPLPPGTSIYIQSIRARTNTDIWAVGYYKPTGSSNYAPFTLHYTGTWNLVPAAPVSGSARFYGVVPVSATEVWAVGRGGSSSFASLAQRWNGATNTWAVASAGLSTCCGLYSVSANGPGDIWSTDGLTVHWNGSTWVRDYLWPIGSYAVLTGGAVASYGNIVTWSFGTSELNHTNKPFIGIHPASAVPSPTPTPTIIPSATPTLGPNEFYDVPPGSLWYPFVHWLAERGIVSGISYGYYAPNANTTRAQFTKMIVAGFGYPLINPPTPYFSDVPTNYWAYQYIETAHAHNVIGGYNQAQCAAIGHAYPCFGPNDNITRAQIVIIVVNAKGWTLNTPGTPTFSDVPANSFA